MKPTFMRPLTWDEVDYVVASEMGIYTNAMERGSLNIHQFIKLGMDKLKKRRGSVVNDESKDPFILRHFHPPLPTYYWSLLLSLSKKMNSREVILRYGMVALGALAILVFFLSLRHIDLVGHTNSNLGIILVIPIMVNSKIFVGGFSILNFHAFHLIAVTIFVASFINFLRCSNLRSSILFGISMSLVVLTLETSAFIFVGAILSLLILKIKIDKRRVIQAFTIFLIITLVAWPGVIWTLGPVKSWLMYVYRIFAVGNAEYKNVSFATSWVPILKENWAVFLVILLGLIVNRVTYRQGEKSLRDILIPFIIGGFYLFAISPFLISSTYIAPAIILLLIGSGMAINKIKVKNLHKALVAVPVLVLIVHGQLTTGDMKEYNLRGHFYKELSILRKYIDPARPMLADGGHIFRYYFELSTSKIIDLHFFDWDNPGYYIRSAYEYIDISQEIKMHKYNPIIVRRHRPLKNNYFNKIVQDGYHRIDTDMFMIFTLNPDRV